jgi:hypothetical protein
MSAVPYLLLSDTRRHALAQRIGTALGRWRQSWAGEQTPQCFVDIPEGGIQSSVGGWQDGVCFQAGPAQRPHMALLIPTRCLPGIVGMPAERTGPWVRPVEKDSLAAQLELEALRALTTEILGTSGFDPATLERTATSVADTLHELNALRYVAARIALGGAKSTFGMLLAPALVSALMPARKQFPLPEHIARRGAAVAAQSIAIDVVLGNAEVSLQELTSLAVGDVIVLSEKLGAPSQVVIKGGAPIAEAALGCLDGRRAIQVESPAKNLRS